MTPWSRLIWSSLISRTTWGTCNSSCQTWRKTNYKLVLGWFVRLKAQVKLIWPMRPSLNLIKRHLTCTAFCMLVSLCQPVAWQKSTKSIKRGPMALAHVPCAIDRNNFQLVCQINCVLQGTRPTVPGVKRYMYQSHAMLRLTVHILEHRLLRHFYCTTQWLWYCSQNFTFMSQRSTDSKFMENAAANTSNHRLAT